MIEKLAQPNPRFRRPYRVFVNARTAFKAFLRQIGLKPDERVLLPAYVGWSSREGSGVFDPIGELGLAYAFYRMDDQLHTDLAHLEQLLREGRSRVVVLIHYFGYVDPGYERAVELAREYGALILEDEAHAMYTDLIGGVSGRLGDACIFSLHKLLPLERGGMLVVNPGRESLLESVPAGDIELPSPWEFDMRAISLRRRENAERLSELLAPLAGQVDSLWGPPPADQVPQTYPVLIRKASRDQVYFAMNEAGFGVVSLYHTMVDAITPQEFPASHRLSRQIMNLPVHQDAKPEALEAMVAQLGKCLQSLTGSE